MHLMQIVQNRNVSLVSGFGLTTYLFSWKKYKLPKPGFYNKEKLLLRRNWSGDRKALLTMPVKLKKTEEKLTLNDRQLAEKACDGCKDSFNELVCRYSERILKFIYNKTRNIECAEDIVQETFVRAWQNIQKYDPQYCFSTWIYTIAVRLMQNHYRKKQPLAVEDEILDCQIRNTESPLESMVKQEDNDTLWKKASMLKPEQYNMLWLKYVEQHSIEDISKVTGKSVTNVKVTLHRARTKLAEML